MKRITLGILAHVDAGKTTLSEGFLYSAGVLSRLGRVDKRDAFLDTHSLERERGITIFSKQAVLQLGDSVFTLIDTPGHIDFSCEAERALSVQDYAVLVISAPDGVGAHTKTLWNLLSGRGIPTFIFVNKTDISERRREELLLEIKNVLSPRVMDFSNDEGQEFFENCAGVDEELIGEFFESERLSLDSLRNAVRDRKIFPCFFGSALKMTGVSEFLSGIDKYTLQKNYSDTIFGAKVYKISRDKQGARLSYVKITGGRLRPKDTITLKGQDGALVEEKIEEIRLYSAEKYKSLSSAEGGVVCALVGPSLTKAGMGLGFEGDDEATLSPVLDYRMIIPKDINPYETYMRLLVLTEEDPSLAMSYEPRTHEIRVRLMGEIQTEILKRVILERFGIEAEFDEGAILYKETVSESVYGAGHFEPLRHYSEVHLRIDPLPEGSGIIAASECEQDTLALNWQRLVLTHIEERVHRGVLTGSPLTDVRITLVAGKAHLKHTDGGDFRQATYRAVRQGLMKAESVLLEPTFDFKIEVPIESLGRAMNDITNMHGVTDPPEINETTAVLTGYCPVATMRSYAKDIRAYTRGEGKISMNVGAYMPCHNAEEVIERIGYDPLLDERHTPSSVFCKAGAGYAVPWNEADALMHITPQGNSRAMEAAAEQRARVPARVDYRGTVEEDKELMRIFESTYGKIKPRKISERVENSAPSPKKERPKKLVKKGESYVVIDGYNFLFAIDELRAGAERDISYARDLLVRMMCDYSAFHKCRSIIVFDAYKREGAEGTVEEYGSTRLVYTKQRETADSYIEKTTKALAEEHTVRVVTSDREEQNIVLGVGGLRVSSREFWTELKTGIALIRESIDFYEK